MPRTSSRPTAEGCRSLVLDVSPVMRWAMEARRAGARAVGMRQGWTTAGDDAPWATVDILVEAGPDYADALLRYDIDHVGHPTGPQVQRVTVASVPCHLGGRRWYWVCPATERHVWHLYLPCGGTRFLSRAAYRLRWASTCATRLDRSHRRLARIAKKLGTEYQGFTREPPAKPPWMRWATYGRLAAAWEAAAGRHDAAWMAGAGRTLRRLGIGTR